MITHAVVRICCDRADGVEYFGSYDDAADWRSEFEQSKNTAYPHRRTGVLLGVDGETAPPHVGLEDHQLWVRIGDHWEVRGTGALL